MAAAGPHEPLTGSILIDLHGESAWEKASFATAVDGDVTAVLGTHTHDPTLRGEDTTELAPYSLATGPMALGAMLVTMSGCRTDAIGRVA